MANSTLSFENKDTVVFWVWQSLAYRKRLLLSFLGIFAGFVVQYLAYMMQAEPNMVIVPGAIIVFAGNLFLLARGCDNRVNFGSYTPSAAWERVDEQKLAEIEQLIKKMKRWDRSALDISNLLGTFIFLIVFMVWLVFFMFGLASEDMAFLIVAIDAAILLFPHWVTGTRSILTQSNLMLKVKLIAQLLKEMSGFLKEHQVEYFMLLKGSDAKLPEDLKFRVKMRNQHPDFLGFYGQIVTNNVSSNVYPYFYVVLVAKNGYGLKNAFNRYSPASNITKEYKTEGDVEVFVIRQTTTKTSGYYTKPKDALRIFSAGLELAEQAAVR